jgi:hypothetical protein
LKFGESGNSYIEYYPDMSPFTNAMSICAWVKKLRSGGNTIWFGYCKGNEIVISDNGDYSNWFHHHVSWDQGVTVEKGKWYHYCATWSISSETRRVYFNGNLIGSLSDVRYIIPSNGNLVIGNDCLEGGNKGKGNSYPFGGELTKLNVFSKELSAAEVKAMTEAGIKSIIEKTHDADRQIRWEDILTKPRYGSVADINLGYIYISADIGENC